MMGEVTTLVGRHWLQVSGWSLLPRIAGKFALGFVDGVMADLTYQEAARLLGSPHYQEVNWTQALFAGVVGGIAKQFTKMCFPAGTPVATEQGLRPIETVRAGARVWGYDLRTYQWRLCEVLETHQRTCDGTMIYLTVRDEVLAATDQ